MVPQRADGAIEVFPRGRDHPAFAGRDRLARMKAEAAKVAERPAFGKLRRLQEEVLRRSVHALAGEHTAVRP